MARLAIQNMKVGEKTCLRSKNGYKDGYRDLLLYHRDDTSAFLKRSVCCIRRGEPENRP